MRWRSRWTPTVQSFHCKATFIDQLKSGALGARTIDEGGMDEKSGMNSSRIYGLSFPAIPTFLDKAKSLKAIAALRVNANRSNSDRRCWSPGLQTITHAQANNEATIRLMKADLLL